MLQEEFTFLSTDGKTKLHAVRFLPNDRKYSAIVQISHGMQEYILRYRDFAEFLTNKGYLVVGHDHLGHGGSVTDENDYGFFTEQPKPSNVVVKDMHKLRLLVQKENPKLPYFMLGHSMGSYMLRKYITRYFENLSGVILVGTGSMPNLTMRTGMFLCHCLGKTAGWHYRSRLVRLLSFAGPYQKYDVSGKCLEKNWLTKDLEIAEKYYQDPQCTYMFTVNGYYGLMEAILYDNQKKYREKIPKNLPILLISGEDDPVGNFGKGVKKAFLQYASLGMSDVQCKLYKGDRHEVLNETDRQDVYEEIESWIAARKNLG